MNNPLNEKNDLSKKLNAFFLKLETLKEKDNLDTISETEFLKLTRFLKRQLEDMLEYPNFNILEKFMNIFIEITKKYFVKNEESYIIINNYYSSILKRKLKLFDTDQLIKELLFFRENSIHFNKKSIFGLFSNLAAQYLIKKKKYNTTLKILKKSILFYEENAFFTKDLNKKEVLNLKTVYITNKMYFLMCLKNYNISQEEFEHKKEEVIKYCEDNFPESEIFKNWIDQNLNLKNPIPKIFNMKSLNKKTTDSDFCPSLDSKKSYYNKTNKKTIFSLNKKNVQKTKFQNFKNIFENLKKRKMDCLFENQDKKQKNVLEKNKFIITSGRKNKNKMYKTVSKIFREDMDSNKSEKKSRYNSLCQKLTKNFARNKLFEKLNFILKSEKAQIKDLTEITKKMEAILPAKHKGEKKLNLFIKKKKLDICNNKNYFLVAKKKPVLKDTFNLSFIKNDKIKKNPSEDFNKFENQKIINNISAKIIDSNLFDKDQKENEDVKKIKEITSKDIILTDNNAKKETKMKKSSLMKKFKTDLLNDLKKNKIVFENDFEEHIFYLKKNLYKFKAKREKEKILILVLKKEKIIFVKELNLIEIDFLLSQENHLNLLPPFLKVKSLKNMNQIFQYYLFKLMVFEYKEKMTSIEENLKNKIEKKNRIYFNNFPKSLIANIEIDYKEKKYFFSMIFLFSTIFRVFFFPIKKENQESQNEFFVDVKLSKKDIETYFDCILSPSDFLNKANQQNSIDKKNKNNNFSKSFSMNKEDILFKENSFYDKNLFVYKKGNGINLMGNLSKNKKDEKNFKKKEIDFFQSTQFKLKENKKKIFINFLTIIIIKNFENFRKSQTFYHYNFLKIKNLRMNTYEFYKIKQTNNFEIILFTNFFKSSKLFLNIKDIKNMLSLQKVKIHSYENDILLLILINLIKKTSLKNLINNNSSIYPDYLLSKNKINQNSFSCKSNMNDSQLNTILSNIQGSFVNTPRNIKNSIKIKSNKNANEIKIYLSNFKVMSSLTVFLRYIYHFPISINLLHSFQNTFFVQILFKDIITLNYQCRFFLLENLIFFHVKNNTDSKQKFLNLIKLKFKKFNWDSFLKNIMFQNEEGVNFKTPFIFLNTFNMC